MCRTLWANYKIKDFCLGDHILLSGMSFHSDVHRDSQHVQDSDSSQKV